MKKTLIVFTGSVSVVILIAVVFTVILSNEQKLVEPGRDEFNTETTFPIEKTTAPSSSTEDTVLPYPAIKKDPVVSEHFLNQIQNADKISLGGTVVTPEYALQLWWDKDKGGETLLKRMPGKDGWEIISFGGGSWSVDSLVGVGVPESIARELIQGRQY